MRDKQNLINTQKALIHAFFDGFMNGVTDANDLKQDESQTLIKTLLNVYEKISEHYAVVMLPILGVVHHESLEQLQCKLDAQSQQGEVDIAALFKVVCGEGGTYEAMVDDYKRLFKGSAVKRAKYAGLMRNIKAVEEFQLRHGQQTNDGNNATTNNKEKKQ